MRINLLVLIFATVVVASCKKHVTEDDHHIPVATIEIISPAAGANYHRGDNVMIQARAVSTEQLHGYDIFISKANDTTTYFFEHIHDHNDTVMINAVWLASITAPADLEANITIYLDHELHTAKKKVAFKVE